MVFNLPCLAHLFHCPPPTLGNTPVKTWKVINKCPLCWRTNTDGIWLTHGGLAQPWAAQGSRQPLCKELQHISSQLWFINILFFILFLTQESTALSRVRTWVWSFPIAKAASRTSPLAPPSAVGACRAENKPLFVLQARR